MHRNRLLSGACLVILAGCIDPADRPEPVYQPSVQTYWNAPYPHDRRLDPDGSLDLTDFPNPYGVPLLESYKAFLDPVQGFGTHAGMVVPFHQPVDPLTLPTPAESTEFGSGVLLLNVDPRSPEFGQAVPLQWEVRNPVASAYLPTHALLVAPIDGHPLLPRTRYALVVTQSVASPAADFASVWDAGHPEHHLYADLKDVLPWWGLGPDDVAIASPFTTRDPLEEMSRLAYHLRHVVELPDLNLPLEHLERFDAYEAFRTHYPSPVYTHGERPYELEGGGFEFDEDGTPRIASWDDMRLAVCAPTDRANPPETGWPVVVYQHGTGGAYRGFCNSSAALEVAQRLGTEGIVGLGIDQPLHGTRGPGNDLTSFNFFNPPSGVSNFRQGALDALYLTRALADSPVTFATPDGGTLPLDPDRVLFMGHSQGGLTGALAAPFFGGDVKAVMLSGTGGILAITIVERKDIIDFEATVRSLMQIGEDEALTSLHPVLALIQTAVEVTDPVNYAPYWFRRRGDWPGQASTSVLLTSGTKDAATHWKTSVALAAAAGLPFLDPQVTDSVAHDLAGLSAQRGPVLHNVATFDRQPQTGAFSQWRDGSHWVIFERTAAAEVYTGFLQTAGYAAPVVE